MGAFTRDNTIALKGLCALVVILVHIPTAYGNPLQDTIGSFAYVAVTIFFMISAYGMLYSLDKSQNYLSSYWRNRLSSLLIPQAFVNIIALVLFLIAYHSFRWSLAYYVSHYVRVLLEWILWFYIIELSLKNKLSQKATDVILCSGVIASSLALYLYAGCKDIDPQGWCYERLGLVWGVIYYRYGPRLESFSNSSKKSKILSFTSLLAASAILGVLYILFKGVYFWGGVRIKDCPWLLYY